MSDQSPGKKGAGTAIWWVAGAAVVIVGGLIALSTLGGKKPPEPNAAGGQTAPTVVASLGTLKSDKDRGATRGVIGRPDAPFKLVEYSDFL